MITRRGLVCAALGVPFSPRLGSRLLLPVQPAFGLLSFAHLQPVVTPLRNSVPTQLELEELERILMDFWAPP